MKYPIFVGTFLIFVMIFATFVDTFGIDKVAKFTTIFTSMIPGIMLFLVARQQFFIAREQKEIAREQKEIARGKFRLDLFEKRHDVYNVFVDFFAYCHDLSLKVDDYTKITTDEEFDILYNYPGSEVIDEITDRGANNIGLVRDCLDGSKNKCEIALNKMIFLYDESISHKMGEFARDVYDLGYDIHNYMGQEILNWRACYVFGDDYVAASTLELEKKKSELSKRLKGEITSEMMPFLHISYSDVS
ncbi:hypothetical protein HLH26_05575 [Gluconacetobacter sp. 1b LMG 1731]|uniref:Uncharacterized protein n=1 Tax=Gluconacetobacter dulcium TaxID=2729096 RepID=A0A7W4IJF7_9PROT|nr:hypothetical protein [Gluconacetobacter dulcium]MBB2164013.1 hypothetical protein [Gluconacetobacter dulcium]MBB2192717.1 hypothetical protein [Gluconacetobacter dulcium]